MLSTDSLPKTLLISYGQGGHQEEMRRVLNKIEEIAPAGTQLIVLTDSSKPIKSSLKVKAEFIYREVRDKHSLLTTLANLPITMIKQIIDTINIIRKESIKGIIVTGPGVSIVPALVCKLLGKKVVVFESWCRFEHKSITGKVLYRFSDLFFIQNRELQKLYKKAIYRGRL